MTQFAASPIMLTMSPTSTTHTPDLLFNRNRRSSIRRGTISSISKDVRVNDFVEIIKKQKEIQQQERLQDTVSLLSVVKRRHSMANMANKLPPTNKQNALLLRSYTRTMSNNDLNKIVSLSKEKQQQQQQQTDKCEACNMNNKQLQPSPITSPSCSSSSSCSSCDSLLEKRRPPFIKEQQNSSTFIHHYDNTNSNTKKQQLLKELRSSISIYSNDINSLLFNSNNLYEDDDDDDEQCIKNKIGECKSLIFQQQDLLNKLLKVIDEEEEQTKEPPPPIDTPNPSSDIIPKKESAVKHICQELVKGFTTSYPKPTTTGIVIKQTKDKNVQDAIFQVNGICTTIESSLIPDRLLNKDSNFTSFNQNGVYQHTYSLNITHQDRKGKFRLLKQEVWQKDDQVKNCSFKKCNCHFNWFQRKHHCRSCGQIYCHTHSGNRLPLFEKEDSLKPTFSRVCDKCFYTCASDSLLSTM